MKSKTNSRTADVGSMSPKIVCISVSEKLGPFFAPGNLGRLLLNLPARVAALRQKY